MAGINKVILVGHLGRDPEVRTIDSGAKVARFTMATTEAYKDREGERKEITEWHTVICWRGLAEIAEKYLAKGRLVYVEGKLRTRSWEDNGAKRYTTEVYADNFVMLGAKQDGGIAPMPVAEPAGYVSNRTTVQDPVEKENLPPFVTEEDDLPF